MNIDERATAIAIAVTMTLTAVLSAGPATAVNPDCNEDYDITATEKQRTLDPDETEVGISEVSALTDETMTVTLETDNDKLEFGIFEDDGTCTRSQNVGNVCDSDVLLDTTGSDSTDSVDCTLEAPLSGDRQFHVVFENLQSSDGLQYSVVSD